MQQTSTNTIAVCRRIYAETRARYGQLLPLMAGGAHGFKILGGPPQDRPQIMFIGYQPGGSAADDDHERTLAIKENWHEDWPSTVEFTVAGWPLAVRMRSIFSIEALQHSVSLNAIFLRFPTSGDYVRALDVRPRRNFEAFCLSAVREIIHLMQPDRIIIVGLTTADLFGSSCPVLNGERGQTLAATLAIEGVEATAIIHLTGARVSSGEFQLLREYLIAGHPAKGAPVEIPPANGHVMRILRNSAPMPVAQAKLQLHPIPPSANQRTGSYTIGDRNALLRRANDRCDPRWVFYDAIVNLDRLEDYYTKFGDLKVTPKTYQSRPRTAHTEMAWARKKGWIIIA